LRAPRLLGADLNGRDTGTPATVESVITGTGAWPAECPTDLLRAAGDAIAQLHTIVLAPQPELPFRPRPIAVDDFASERRLGRMPTTELLRRADERVHAIPVPTRPTVFIHGDVWPGNTVLAGDTVRALIDWKTAGVGYPGVDLGELRKQVAIAYGEEAQIRAGRLGTSRWYSSPRRAVVGHHSRNTPTESNGPCDAAPAR
jgi:aminoglycoside phosphotransferase (APT) family kinase protein